MKTIKSIKKIIPVGIQVVIEPDEPVAEISGIVIPQSSQEDPLTGTVLDVGEGRADYKMTVRKGDTVKYPRFGWSKFDLVMEDGSTKKVICIKENEIHVALRDYDLKEVAKTSSDEC